MRVVGLELCQVVGVGVIAAGGSRGDGAARDDADQREPCAGCGARLAHRLHHTGVGPTVDDVGTELLAERHDSSFEQLLRRLQVGTHQPLRAPDDDEHRARSRHFELTERGRQIIRARDTDHSCHEAGYRSR